jgi:hypothetical protein
MDFDIHSINVKFKNNDYVYVAYNLLFDAFMKNFKINLNIIDMKKV